MLFLLKSLTSAHTQGKGNAGNGSHGETLGKPLEKEEISPELVLQEPGSEPPSIPSSGHGCDPNPVPGPLDFPGIVIAEPLWHFSGAELNVLCGLKAFPGNSAFLGVPITSRGNGAKALVNPGLNPG